MSIEETILEKVKKLPARKREQVLKFLDSIAEPDDDNSEIVLADDEQQSLWTEWVKSGPHGPIEDDGLPEFP
jgi:mRNA-degrading endonuclease RelE of RelBE toxin-antitoxin system